MKISLLIIIFSIFTACSTNQFKRETASLEEDIFKFNDESKKCEYKKQNNIYYGFNEGVFGECGRPNQSNLELGFSNSNSERNLKGISLAKLELADLDLRGRDLEGADFTEANFEDAQLDPIVFFNSTVKNAINISLAKYDKIEESSKVAKVPLYWKKHAAEFNLGFIQDYYSSIMGGFIYPVEDKLKQDSKFSFDHSLHWDKTIFHKIYDRETYTLVQDAFSVNVEKLLNYSGAKDFAEVSLKYYGNIPYNAFTARHFRPYYFLKPWNELFHPPIKKLVLSREKYVRSLSSTSVLNNEDSPFYKPEFHRSVDLESNTFLTSGNTPTLLVNKDSYEQKIRMIRESKKFLFAVSMIFICQDSTKRLLNELIKAHERGVDVKVAAEGLHKIADNGCLKSMIDNGLDVLIITTSLHKNSFKGVMHSKYWIRDNEEAILGGMNILDAENNSTGFSGENRDTDVHFRGPVVTELLSFYSKMWNEYGDKEQREDIQRYISFVEKVKIQEHTNGLRGTENYERWLSDPSTKSHGLCRLASQFAGASKTPIAPILIKYVNASSQNLYFSNPSFNYDIDENSKKRNNLSNTLTRAVKDKARSGVQTTIITNGFGGGAGEIEILLEKLMMNKLKDGENLFARILEKIDYKRHTKSAIGQFPYYKDLTEIPNTNLWLYFQYIHAKTYMFDRTAVAVGSYNFDWNSAEVNFETMVFCMDDKLRNELEDSFALDISNSIPFVSSKVENN